MEALDVLCEIQTEYCIQRSPVGVLTETVDVLCEIQSESCIQRSPVGVLTETVDVLCEIQTESLHIANAGCFSLHIWPCHGAGG
jgi:hypothetical protein